MGFDGFPLGEVNKFLSRGSGNSPDKLGVFELCWIARQELGSVSPFLAAVPNS
jgi:hypothetical protein